MNKQRRLELASRIVFVGCQICGTTDRTLRNYQGGKICPVCLTRKQREVSNLDTRNVVKE
ncbi:MAG: hypothetical protein HFF04_00870 [Oscillospiraceae bacterium]|nr:hypothetical protein [Oscillospiraceae bacterium]